jgi:putative transposase
VTDTPKDLVSKNGTKLWLYRPFSRVVRGWKAFKTVRDYIQLNEKEVNGKIKYSSKRLAGLSSGDWKILWA